MNSKIFDKKLGIVGGGQLGKCLIRMCQDGYLLQNRSGKTLLVKTYQINFIVEILMIMIQYIILGKNVI